jgi:hypothetical protein
VAKADLHARTPRAALALALVATLAPSQAFADPPAAPAAARPWSDQKTGAMAAGGAGVIAIGVGVIFGVQALNAWSKADRECASGCPAGSTGLQDRINGNIEGSVTAAAFIGGGVLLAGAAVLWFTAPSGARVQLAPTATGQGWGLTLKGTF